MPKLILQFETAKAIFPGESIDVESMAVLVTDGWVPQQVTCNVGFEAICVQFEMANGIMAAVRVREGRPVIASRVGAAKGKKVTLSVKNVGSKPIRFQGFVAGE